MGHERTGSQRVLGGQYGSEEVWRRGGHRRPGGDRHEHRLAEAALCCVQSLGLREQPVPVRLGSQRAVPAQGGAAMRILTNTDEE